jgi:hypothetical protein
LLGKALSRQRVSLAAFLLSKTRKPKMPEMIHRGCNTVAPDQWSDILKNGLRRPEAADYLKQKYGVGSPSLLAKQPAGLNFYKRGKDAIYMPDDLDSWGLGRIRPVEPTVPPESAAE